MNELSPGSSDSATATLIDDDPNLATAVSVALQAINVNTQVFGSAEEFLSAVHHPPAGCLLVDLSMKEMSGLELLRTIRKRGWGTPAIVVSGTVTVPEAMDAVEYGVVDVVQKPVRARRLQEVVEKALSTDKASVSRGILRQRVETLTEKEAGVLAYMLEGRMNKSIAFRMDIGLRSVVRHKQSVLEKLKFKEAADLIHEWGRLGMDAPRIGPSDASAALPRRVREEIRMSVNDIVARLGQLATSGTASPVELNSAIQDLAGLTESDGLLSPGELTGQPRECPYVTILSDSQQESRLLSRLLRLHQFFPEICHSADEVVESLLYADRDGIPVCVILNGDECVTALNRVLHGVQSTRKDHPFGIIAISTSADATMSSMSTDDVWLQHLSYPFDPQDVIDAILTGMREGRREPVAAGRMV